MTVPIQAGSPTAAAGGSEASLRVGLLSPDGHRTTWVGTVSTGPGPPGTAVVAAPAPTPASAIVLETVAPGPVSPATVSRATVKIGAAVVKTAGQGTYRVDGSLRDVVTPGQWRFARMIGRFCVFTTASAQGRAWVQGGRGGAAHVVSSTPWGDETIRVTTTRPALLMRSQQFATGWQATVTTVSARPGVAQSRTGVGVRRQGLIQAVEVPAGTSLVHFTYRPHRVLEGFVASALGVVALIALVAWPAFRRRRRGVGARHSAAR